MPARLSHSGGDDTVGQELVGLAFERSDFLMPDFLGDDVISDLGVNSMTDF